MCPHIHEEQGTFFGDNAAGFSRLKGTSVEGLTKMKEIENDWQTLYKDKDRLEERKIAVLGPVLIFPSKVEVKDSEAR